jgi:hypothetical protein
VCIFFIGSKLMILAPSEIAYTHKDAAARVYKTKADFCDSIEKFIVKIAADDSLKLDEKTKTVDLVTLQGQNVKLILENGKFSLLSYNGKDLSGKSSTSTNYR